jgi:glycosyltransferase involved in cell wall biosynthesis
MYLRRDALTEFGAFDPECPPVLAAVDFSLRAWRRGRRTVYAGASWLLRCEPAAPAETADAGEARAQAYFWRKYAGFFRRQVCDARTDRPRVIFVTQHSGVGGGHRVILTHANHLARHGYAVELWNLAGAPDWFPLDPGIPVRIFGSYHELVRVLAAEHAIKIATWWETAEPVWLASVLNGIPAYFVQDIESSYYDGVDGDRAAKVLSRYRPEFNYVVTGGWLKRELEQRLRLDAIDAGLGYQSDRFRPLGVTRRDRTILVAVRGDRLKNFDYSKRILARLRRHQVRVIAFGSEGKGLLDGLADVEFHPRPDDEALCRLYNEAWFFLQTSIHEGFSLPPIEAMACGCVPIVTAAGGNEEYIEDGRNCIQIPHGDVDGAVAKILPALDDFALRQCLAAAGGETAGRYEWKESHRRLEAFVNTIAARPEYGVRVRDADLI